MIANVIKKIETRSRNRFFKINVDNSRSNANVHFYDVIIVTQFQKWIIKNSKTFLNAFDKIRKHKDREVKLVENYIIMTIVVELNWQINIEIINKTLTIIINVTKVVIAFDNVEKKIVSHVNWTTLTLLKVFLKNDHSSLKHHDLYSTCRLL